MNVAAAWVIVLAACAQNGETKEPLRVMVTESKTNRLVGHADVAIYAPGGQRIRYGQTGLFGEPFDAESVEPLSPVYKQLRVVAQKYQGGRIASGSTTIEYDGKRWKPQTTEERKARKDSPGARVTLAAQVGQLGPGPNVPGPLTNAVIEVAIPVEPPPVCRMPPWQWYVGDCAPYAPPPCIAAGPAAPGLSPPPCQRIGPVPPPLAWLPPAVPPFGASSPGASQQANRDAAITEAGHPTTPDFDWAPFGSRWIVGPYGMYWQAPMMPKQPKTKPPAQQRSL